jgi:nitrous oxidase accessory protein NosD
MQQAVQPPVQAPGQQAVQQPMPAPGGGQFSQVVALALILLMVFVGGGIFAILFFRPSSGSETTKGGDTKTTELAINVPPTTPSVSPTTPRVVTPTTPRVVTPTTPRHVPPTTKPKPPDGPMVDPDGPGFRTIKGALAATKPGGVVTIKGGTYSEALVLDQAVTLMPWKGEKVEVVAPRGEVALTVACDRCAVRNLTLRGEVGPGNRKHPIVQITQGDLELDGCDIGWVGEANRKNDAGACVEVRGAGARPKLIGCHLHNGWQGLYIVEGARPVVEDCKVFDNQVGVWVEKAGGRLTKCFVRRSRAANVSVTGKGTQVDLNGGEILDSEGGGVVVIEGGKLKLSAVEVHHNKGPAFEVRGTDSFLDASDCKGADVHDNNPGGKPWEFDEEKTFRPPTP